MPHRTEYSNKFGYTLAELLIAIAIVAGLVALLFPAIASIRYKAAEVRCLGNIRVYGNAMFLYMNDYGGLPDVPLNVNPDYRSRLPQAGYLNYPTVTHLPVCSGNPGGYRGTYAGSAGLCYYYRRLKGLRAPLSKVILAGENYYGDFFDHPLHFNSTMWGTPTTTSVTRAQFDQLEGTTRAPQYHGSKTKRGLHVFLADGSAALLFPDNQDWANLSATAQNPNGYWYATSQYQRMKNGTGYIPPGY